jgi:predicted hotdog family 3-hydroxylacyl-ACP dehydratase
MSTVPAMDALVPHRRAMQLLDAVLRWDDLSVTCVVTLRDGAAFVVDGRAPTSLCLEHIAQAAAAHLGLRAGETPRRGHLIAVRELVLHAPHLVVGDALEVTATRDGESDDVARYAGSVSRGGVCVAEATITVRMQGAP